VEAGVRAAFIPASTYKIFHSLVALETGVVADEHTTLPWDGVDLFWLEGGLRISPYEQVRFLRRLYDDDLPFSQRTMDIVKDALRAKTGWGLRFSPQVGWFVGYVERDPKPLFFALNLDIVETANSEARIAIARRLLGDLGVLTNAGTPTGH
jgi:beta-lactamase class D